MSDLLWNFMNTSQKNVKAETDGGDLSTLILDNY